MFRNKRITLKLNKLIEKKKVEIKRTTKKTDLIRTKCININGTEKKKSANDMGASGKKKRMNFTDGGKKKKEHRAVKLATFKIARNFFPY